MTVTELDTFIAEQRLVIGAAQAELRDAETARDWKTRLAEVGARVEAAQGISSDDARIIDRIVEAGKPKAPPPPADPAPPPADPPVVDHPADPPVEPPAEEPAP